MQCAWLTVLLLLATWSGQAIAGSIRQTSMMDRGYLRGAIRASEYIVIGTIVDTTYCCTGQADGRPDIMTAYSVAVRELLRGPGASDSTIRFRVPGGRCGRFVRILSPGQSYDIGSTYLLFLARCGADSLLASVDAGGMDALVVRDSVRFQRSRKAMHISAVQESVRVALADLTPEFQIGQCDLAAVIVIDTLSTGSEAYWSAYKNGLWSGRVIKALLQRRGPSPPPDASIRIRIPLTTPREFLCDVTRPRVSPGEEYLMFLNLRENEWTLGPLAYAAWKRDGHLARVSVFIPQCTGWVILAERNWEDLLDSLTVRQ